MEMKGELQKKKTGYVRYTVRAVGKLEKPTRFSFHRNFRNQRIGRTERPKRSPRSAGTVSARTAVYRNDGECGCANIHVDVIYRRRDDRAVETGRQTNSRHFGR